MDFLEKDLEDIIYEAPNLALSERGLDIWGKKFRQLNLGNYGRLDLMSIRYCHNYKAKIIDVFELKRDEINIDAFLQAVRYVRGIQEYQRLSKWRDVDVIIRINLIGRSIDLKSDFPFISDVFPWHKGHKTGVNMYTYEYDYNGLLFKPEYDFKFPKTGRLPIKDSHLHPNLKL